MGRKSTTKYLQEIIDVMEDNNLSYIELQHPVIGLVKLSKKEIIENEEEETIPIKDLSDKGDFEVSEKEWLYAST